MTANGMITGFTTQEINEKRLKNGLPLLPPSNVIGRKVTWWHKAKGKIYHYTGTIIEVIKPDGSLVSDGKSWHEQRRKLYNANFPGEGRALHDRYIVKIKTTRSRQYRFPFSHRVIFIT